MLELSQTNTAASYYIWYFKLVCASMSCFYVGMHIRANGFRQQVRDLPAQDVSRPPPLYSAHAWPDLMRVLRQGASN
jgi:hypothetical protein